MTLQELIKLYRFQAGDEVGPYLTDDETLLGWLIEAQDELVRAFGGFSDMTVTEASDVDDVKLHDLEVTEEEPYTEFSSWVLRIRSARLLTVKRDVRIISEAEFSHIRISDYGQVNPVFLDDEDIGIVTHAIIGLKDNNLRWYRVPESDDTCRLHVYRMAYPRIETQEDELEVDERHHRHLLKYVKYMAYNTEDAEIYDKDLANRNKTEFEAYCEKVRQEVERIRFKPRSVQYGGL